MKKSAESRHTLAERKDGLLFLTFLLLEFFDVAVALAAPTKARLSILRWGLAPPAMYSIPPRGGTMIAFSNSLAFEGGREPIHKVDRKSTRLNSSHVSESRMPSSA